jgi:2-polyprenyl-3-methyl-5-hydroxy-6-metoxy-1,4-benzoquinol methylase
MTGSERDQRLTRAEAGARALYDLGVRRVWLFGSLAQGHLQDGHSDIDFAVEGIPPHRMAEDRRAARHATGRVTDVIALETAPPDLRGAAMRARRLMQPPEPDGPGAAAAAQPPPRPITRAQRRIDAVLAILLDEEVRRLLDLGCGEGRLLNAAAATGRFARLGGVDLDARALARASGRVAGAAAASRSRPVVDLWHGLITHRDERLRGYEAATAVEVIEHLEPPQLNAFAGVLLGFARPRLAILTTPNAEYNARWRIHGRRHPDHRFEWDRATFAAWSGDLAQRWGYAATLSGIGPCDPGLGHPTQLVLLHREEG